MQDFYELSKHLVHRVMLCRKPSDVMIFIELVLFSLAVLHLDIGSASKASNGSYIWNERRLYDHLMNDYKKFIRPVHDSRETVAVKLSLTAFTIEDLDENNQALTLIGFCMLMWKDAGLVWNYEDFNELYHTQLPSSDIWYPDINILNSKNVNFFPFTPLKHHTTVVSFHGSVLWLAKINIETHCELDLSEFPFDEHVCKVVFASWNHKGLEINLTSPDVDARADYLMSGLLSENHEWQLVKVTVERKERLFPCCELDIFPELIYKFTLKRRSTFATHLFIGPSVMLCILTPVVLLLPPGSGEKIIFGIGVLIADTLLLGELIDFMPSSSHSNIPLIAKYYLANIVMASLSLAISAIIIGFWNKGSTRLSGPHAFFRLVILGPVASILCVRKDDFFPADEISNYYSIEINPEGEEGTESTSEVDPGTDRKQRFMSNYLRNAARSEWRQLAVVFDRLLFVIYCVILAILTLSFARYI